MATKRTRWKPDTCDCVIEYEWDDALPVDSITHTPVVADPCAVHAGISTIADRYSAVMDENNRKNLIYSWIYDHLVNAVEEVQTPGGTEIRLVGGRAITWQFNGSRQIEVQLINFTDTERTQVQAAADSQWPGKVIIAGS